MGLRAMPEHAIDISRTSHSVTARRAEGNWRTVASTGPMHWRDGTTWREIDLGWVQTAEGFHVPSGAYHASFHPDTYTLDYRSRSTGRLTLRLVSIDGAPPPRVVTPQQDGAKLRVPLGRGASLVVVARAQGVEVFRRYDGPAIPILEWEIVNDGHGSIATNITAMTGVDNITRAAESRHHELLWRNERRLVEVISDVLRHDVRPDGQQVTRVRESISGKTLWRHPSSRAPHWRQELEFPLLIDVTVTEDIATNLDDGYAYVAGASETWFDGNNIIGTLTSSPAWRFQTVNVPQGATITSATLRVNVENVSTDYSAAMYGENVDSASSWAAGSSNGPNRMARTTASITFDGFGSLGLITKTVTTLIQEIVNRPGWSANNDLRLGCLDAPTGADQVVFSSHNYDPGNAAHLVIDYTAGATGAARRIGLLGVG